MADQLSSGAVTGVPAQGGHVSHASGGTAPHESFHGRTVSWVAVSLIMVAFVTGGVGLILGPAWWLFWASVALAGVGGLLALATNIFADWY